MIITLEEHKQKSRMDLLQHALKTLNKAYPGQVWGGRCEGMTTISIVLAKLLEWGGDVQTYHIHDNAWSNLSEFETIVRRFGGELLERCNQSRKIGNPYRVETLPEGFNPRFTRNMKLTRMKLVMPDGSDPAARAQKRIQQELITP